MNLLRMLYYLFATLIVASFISCPKPADDIDELTFDLINWIKISDLAVKEFDRDEDGNLYAVSYHGILYHSTIDGAAWTSLGSTPTSCSHFAISAGGDFFATNDTEGILRSTDGGDSWTLANNGLPTTRFKCLEANSMSSLFAISSGQRGNDDSLFLSTNNGDSWIWTGMCDDDLKPLAINPQDVLFVDQQFNWPMRSVDNGVTWTEVGTGLTNRGFNAFAFNSEGTVFGGTAAPNGGVFRSYDLGDQWEVTALSFGNTTDSVIVSLAVNSHNILFAATIDAGIFYSADDGDTWIHDTFFSNWVYDFTFNSDNYVFAATVSGLYRSSDPVL